MACPAAGTVAAVTVPPHARISAVTRGVDRLEPSKRFDQALGGSLQKGSTSSGRKRRCLGAGHDHD
jgi:hypothetical protein